MDGGTVWDVNPYSAVEQCMEMVDDPADIIVDITLCTPWTEPRHHKKSDRNAVGNIARSKRIKMYYNGLDSVSQAMRAYPEVDWRYLFLEMGLSNPLDFRNKTTWPIQEQGRQDAQDMLNISEQGFSGF